MLKYIWQEYCESFYSWEKIITNPDFKRAAEPLILTWVNQGSTKQFNLLRPKKDNIKKTFQAIDKSQL